MKDKTRRINMKKIITALFGVLVLIIFSMGVVATEPTPNTGCDLINTLDEDDFGVYSVNNNYIGVQISDISGDEAFIRVASGVNPLDFSWITTTTAFSFDDRESQPVGETELIFKVENVRSDSVTFCFSGAAGDLLATGRFVPTPRSTGVTVEPIAPPARASCDLINALEEDEYGVFSVNGVKVGVQLAEITGDEAFVRLASPASVGDQSWIATATLFEFDSRETAQVPGTNIRFQVETVHSDGFSFCFNGGQAELLTKGKYQPPVPTIPRDPTPADVRQTLDFKNLVNIFTSGNQFNGYLVVGETSPAIDNLALVDIAAGFDEGGIAVVNAARLDSEIINNPWERNLIVVGRLCENRMADKLMNFPSSCDMSNQLSPGQGLLKLYDNGNTIQLLVTGYDADSTRKAAKILANLIEEQLEGDVIPEFRGSKVLIEGTVNLPQITSDFTERPIVRNSRPQLDVGSPTPTPRVDTRVDTNAPTCGGCQQNGNCLPYGTRSIQDGQTMYCGIDGQLHRQQALGESCQNNYECTSNQCSTGQCIDLSGQLREATGILERIFAWLRAVFGSG
jgi:hypothetical protein